MKRTRSQITNHKSQGKHNARSLEFGIWNLGLGALLFCFLLLPSAANATHLMGGWSGYQYLGINSATGNYRYQATIKIYRYCQDQSQPCNANNCNTANLDATCQIGAYIQNFLNPNDPNKVLAASFTLPLTSQTWVPLPGASQCATAPVVCVEEGVYTDIIELPPSNGGYHLIYQRCCRNNNIINLSNPGGEGMLFYSFVPPTFINNSSPTFAQPPVPYICANDTASILNTAFDPDGDVIVYSLVHPYSTTPPATALPPLPNPYTFPLPLVVYQGGYSATQPFGAGGYANVNAFTGISQYLAPTTGNYVVAVELQEYRNNQLVGITRLDIQIIVITCPPNNPPVLSSTTSQINYVANEGDSLCFPITFTDANNDSIFFNAIGNIFSSPPTTPPATLSPNPNSGQGSVTSQFCWDLACNQTGNFIFIVQVPDDGCPPKVANVVYTIQVLPYNGPSSITGPTVICQNSTATYSVSASSGTSFNWSVTGGSIASGQGTNVITVNWGSAGNGTVNVTSFNQNGCPAGPVTLNVSIQAIPVINAGPDATICIGSTVNLTSSGGGTYSWSPSSGLSNTNISNPIASPTVSTGYIVTVTSAINCSNTDTVNITVNQLPAVNAGPDVSICAGFSSTIGGSPTGPAGASYNWSPSSGLNSATLANPTASPTITTTYTVIVSDVNTCNDTDMVTVTVNQPPVANAGADVTVCPAASTTLTGTGGGTYNWSPSSSLSNPNVSNPVASPTASTTYTLIVTQNNCTDTDFVSVTTLPFPAVSAGPDASICIGNATTLSATGTGTFVWSPSSGLSCTTCTNPVANPTSTTGYTLTITDANSCTNTDVVQVTVNPLPNANAGPQPGWVCPGFSTTLNASNGVTYLWTPSASLSNPNISNPVASPTVNTQYTVNITDANGCANWDTLTILLTPAVPTNAGNNATVCLGQSVTLGGNPTAPSPNTIYQWSPSTGLNNATAANPVATPTITTTYTVFSASDTCNGMDTVTVIVNALPSISAGNDATICAGDSVTLTASGGNSYSWSTAQNSATIIVSPTSSSTYTVTGTDTNGCSNTDAVSVAVNALPSISAGSDATICTGDSAVLTASGGNLYSWSSTQTTTTITVAPTSSSTYTVIGTDASGCSNTDSATVFINALPSISAGSDATICSGDSATLSAQGGITYSWSTTQTSTSITVLPTSSSTYTVIGTDANGCSNIDSASVFVNALPAISAGNNVTICSGDSAVLTASGGNLYSWSTGQTTTSITVMPTSSSTYTVVGTDASGCSNQDSASVFVLGLPSVAASSDTAICAGDSAFLSASGGISYSWSPSSSLNNSSIANPIATPTATTNYTVTLTGVNGCINYDTVKIFVNPLPNIYAGSDTVICPGGSATLSASGAASYFWSTSQTINPILVSSAATYTVTGTDANGCSNADSVSVSLGIIPTANFGYTLSLACEGMQAQFLDSSQNAAAWQWDFGDGISSTLQNPAHSFNYGSGYVVTLVAYNPPCSDTAQKIIAVSILSDYLSLKTSNVFTPNSDGVNDCFNLIPQTAASAPLAASFAGCANLTIYDRWGVPVYHSAYSGACWDGTTTAGLPVPAGTYFFIFDLNGIEEKGFITVLR